MYPVSRDRSPKFRSDWDVRDAILILAVLVLILGIIRTGAQFTGSYSPNYQIQTNLRVLPGYTAQTLLRMTAAYLLSLGFTLVYAYSAYRSKLAAYILLPLLDILQSIPVLSFLPGVVLALIAIFPGQRIGVEIAAVLLIFTGMTWNMTFSFYQSLVTIPKELIEAARIYRLNPWQRFWQVELPAGAIGLIWNSVMSVAGGWFFLMAIESFTLGNRDFRLPGLGSFLATASNQGNLGAILAGVAVLIVIITLLDFLLWQPLIAWAEKFKFESVEAVDAPDSPILDFLRRSPTLRSFNQHIWTPLVERFDRTLATRWSTSKIPVTRPKSSWGRWLNQGLGMGFMAIVLWGTWEAVLMLRVLGIADWQTVIMGAAYTSGRVLVALVLSLLWTIPVGVAIGRNPKLAKILQPIVQIAASVPATALFPVLLIGLAQIGGGLQIGSIALMMLGTMWYILFNVIAGAQSIPSDLFEAATVYKLSLSQRWFTLILPGIFPYLVTGIITAVGGAWNASIVSEYIEFQGKVIDTPGLGAIISQATATGNFPLLVAATGTMSLVVVLTNRLVWRRLYQLAQEKYQILI